MTKRKRQNNQEDIELVRLSQPEAMLDDDTLHALSDYIEALRAIATRLEKEGYTFVDGKLRRPDDIQT